MKEQFGRIPTGQAASLYTISCGRLTAAVTDYGIPITAAVEQGNIFGCQFHPEKSGNVGLEILKKFCNV